MFGVSLGIIDSGGAGGGGGSYESIATAVGTGSNTSITFSSIPSTYKHLQIRVIGRNNIAASDASFAQMQVNGDTGSNYAQHELFGDGASVSAGGSASISSMQYGTIVRNSATSGIVGVSIIDIQDYASTTRNKTLRILTGNDRNGAGILALFSGLWMSTSAVTSLTFFPNNVGGSQAFTTATVFSLYGIKG
jgi:hypothetical protein